MKNPDVALAVWIAAGLVIGIGMGNVGVGIAVGAAIGILVRSNKET